MCFLCLNTQNSNYGQLNGFPIYNVHFLCYYRKTVGDVGERVLRSTPDWGESAINGDHLWVPTSVSGDFCYVGDTDCTVITVTNIIVS